MEIRFWDGFYCCLGFGWFFITEVDAKKKVQVIMYFFIL